MERHILEEILGDTKSWFDLQSCGRAHICRNKKCKSKIRQSNQQVVVCLKFIWEGTRNIKCFQDTNRAKLKPKMSLVGVVVFLLYLSPY